MPRAAPPTCSSARSSAAPVSGSPTQSQGTGVVDGDGDGVADSIETSRGSFDDPIPGQPDTTGSIVSLDPGVSVLVTDAPDPAGVDVVVSGASGRATFSLCGLPTVHMSVGTHAVVTCGSLDVQVITGAAEVVLSSTTTVTVPQDVTAKLSDNGDGTFAVQVIGTGAVTVTAGGVVTTVPAGPPVTVDTTPPVITPHVSGALGTNGWYVGDVSVTWTVTDGGSAVTSSSGCDPVSITTDTAGLTLTCTATSGGGTASQSVTVKRDATPPSVAFGAHPASFTVDQTVVIGCTATDALSQVAVPCAGVNAPAYQFAVGADTVSTSAKDGAGNTGTATTSFTVSDTPGSLCRLTGQFIDGSAKYRALKPVAQKVVDAIVNGACKSLEAIGPRLTARQKTVLVAEYQAAVATLARSDWLSPAEAATLRRLALAL